MKFLDGKILELLSKDFMHVARSAHRYSILTVFSRHAATQLKCSVNRDSASRSNAGECSECCDGLCGQTAQRSVG